MQQQREPEEWLTTSDVAALLGVRVGTVSAYRARGQMPAPDKTLGRTHLWHKQTIDTWNRGRPRVGDAAPPDAPAVGEATIWRAGHESTIYENEWVSLSLVRVTPPGHAPFDHHVVTLKPAAMVALLDDAGERVLLMWRHRFAVDAWNWELPGGIIEDGEDPEVTAAREAVEETGFRPVNLEHVVTFEPNIGMVRNAHHVYLSRGAEHVGEPTETTEMQRMEWVPLDDVQQLIADGKIVNSGTLVALLYVLATRADGAMPTS